MDAVRGAIVFLLWLCLVNSHACVHSETIHLMYSQTWSVFQLSKSSTKFCGRRISYYPNSDSSFQISLLPDGDINPNPGPDVQPGNRLPEREGITYHRDQLLDLGHHTVCQQKLSPILWRTLTSLHISRKKKTRRGRRAGVQVNRTRQFLPISGGVVRYDGSEIPEPLPHHTAQTSRDSSATNKVTRIGLWNARSMTNKTECITDLIINSNLDILVITESWLTGDRRDDLVIAAIKSTLPNYSILQCPRIGSKGGGLCVLHRSSARASLNETQRFTSFELMDITFHTTPASVLRVFAIYRPPPSSQNRLTNSSFLLEFSTLLESAAIADNFPILVGDFNIHIDDTDDNYAKAFLNSVDSLGFQQHVNEPTHRAGHTLDLILSRKVDNIIKGVSLLSGLPSDLANVDLANAFGESFNDKIGGIVSSFSAATVTGVPLPSHPTSTKDCKLSEFDQVSETQVKDLIKIFPSKTCSLDPLPTWLVKSCTDELIPVITHVINLSLSSGIVPDPFKTALITPLLKKSGLDHNDLKNYRPIANLPFLDKVLEKVVAAQLRRYLDRHELFPHSQSAYRHFHSTETALVKVLNDLLLAIDKGLEAVLILLDYSAAFDTLDHIALCHRLETRYGVTGTVLQWIESYLNGRSQKIVVNGSCSKSFSIPYGVPQGSVIGPLLFILFTGPLGGIINFHHGVQHMVYADDTQIYLILKPTEQAEAMHRLKDCIEDVKKWSVANKLQLNEMKTEMLHITSQFRNSNQISYFELQSGSIQRSESVRDLGILLDDNLTLHQHIRKVCRSASWGVCKIGKLRKFLNKPATDRLVHAFITSHLDYCNCLFAGLPNSHIAPLQRIQNTAARLVTRTKKSEHITPVLQSLNWLPIHQRICFKVLLLVYKIYHKLAPVYLQDLVSFRSASTSSSTRRLRSAATAHLQLCPGPRTVTRYGDRAFSSIAPQLWNNLPVDIRSAPTLDSFKTMLKTHLYNQSYCNT